jgi:uncharacterized repeat protein (TIGR03803 family)
MKFCCRKTVFATFAFCVAMVIAAHGQTFKTLLDFNGPNGAIPSSLIQGIDGSLYGTTEGGGANSACLFGCGTVFKIAAGSAFKTLYSFCAQPNCADGVDPVGLVLATDGNFYGTTIAGGASGRGTVFKITSAGSLTTLYNFCSQINCIDGAQASSLIQATDGNFYGTTYEGGSNCVDTNGCGTVFRITPAGTLTTLYSFCSQRRCFDGANPDASLIQATDGNLYGTTSSLTNCGGASCYGTVFRITLKGKLTNLHSFQYSDGANPAAALVQAIDANLYGTTNRGGADPTDCTSGCGTVFKMNPQGTLTTLYIFQGPDGGNPATALVEATDGNLYGTTYAGGIYSSHCIFNGCGTVFQVTPAGTLTTLHYFQLTDGGNPLVLLQSTNGSFYGGTDAGGDLACSVDPNGCGTLFRLSGLDPFVSFVRGAAKVGRNFGILGQGFTGSTDVSLNGTHALFTVKSDPFILATVPSGATTGYVTVTTPSGTLTSNKPFVVIP